MNYNNEEKLEARIAELERELAAKEHSLKCNRLDVQTLNYALNRASELERDIRRQDETIRVQQGTIQRLEKENAEVRGLNDVRPDDHVRQYNQLHAQVVRLREALKMIECTTWAARHGDTSPIVERCQKALSESPQHASKELLGPVRELLTHIAKSKYFDKALTTTEHGLQNWIDKEIRRIERLL